MPHNFVADSFYTKKLCSTLSSSKVRFYLTKGRFAFSNPFGVRSNVFILGSLKAHSRLPISVN